MVDQQTAFFVDLARRNFAWKRDHHSGLWEYGMTHNKTHENSGAVRLDPARKLWSRWYEYNERTLSPGAISTLKSRARSAWGLQFAEEGVGKWFLQVHPMVWTLLTFFWQRKLRPVAAQVPVACLFTPRERRAFGGQKNLGTFIDLLMFEPPEEKSRPGTLWALELKKMQNGPGGGARAPLRYQGGLGFVRVDGEYSTAAIQALFAETLLRHNYRLPSRGILVKSAVLRVCSAGVGFQKTPSHWKERLLSALPSARAKT